MNIIQQIKGKVIVSCQSHEGEPLYGPNYMAKMAKTVELGGAGGIRANGPEDIQAIRAITNLPIIGIYKIVNPKTEVIITPTFSSALEIVRAGADIIAIDVTKRPREDGSCGIDLVKKIKKELDILVMADISTLDEGIAADRAGADIIATTLSGYTKYSKKTDGPDLDLVKNLVKAIEKPVILEGRIRNPQEAVKAFDAGAWSVVVGTAITMPHKITESFVEEVNRFFNN